MSDVFAKLTLYHASCPKTDPSQNKSAVSGEYEVGNHTRKEAYVMEIIEEHLQPEFSKKLHITGGSLVPNEEKAKAIIAYSEENINEAKGSIEIDEVSKKRITFHRRIIFDGWLMENKEKLMGSLKKSGYMPKDEDVLDDALEFFDPTC
ncbi:MAG: hypothetical protein V3U72_04625 [Candidatus Aenigmarchaeota archaeon]